MITYEQMCKTLEAEVKGLTELELRSKILEWSKKRSLKIYVQIFEKELKTRD